MASPFAASGSPSPSGFKGVGGYSDWEYDDISVGGTCSGLSDLISLQGSENGSPRIDDFEDPPPRRQSLTSAVSPFAAAAWGFTERPQEGLLDCGDCAHGMEWTGTGTTVSEEDGDGSGSAKKPDATRAVKRARRREQQKAAQQRYRQRIRFWATDMEGKVSELSKEHEEVKAQRAKLVVQRTSLEVSVRQMEEALAQKSAEEAALRQRLGAWQDNNKLPPADPAQLARTAAQQLSDSVAAIRAHVEAHNLCTKQGRTSGPQEVQQLLAVYNATVAAQRPHCPAEVQGEAEVGAEGEAAALKRQRSIAKALQLTPVQCQTLAWIRERQLKKVAVLANARRELNMQAMSQMLPSLRLPAAGMGEQLGSLALASGAVPREVAELDIALDAIKANIGAEREAMTELGDLVMQRALKPYQAAVFIVESFPSRPDGFALVTAVAQNLRSQKSEVHGARACA